MNFQEMVDLVRTYVGFPAPASGGTDRLSNTNIIRWLNDGFDKMVNAVYGLEKYTEFTITDVGAIVVTEPAAGESPPTIAVNNPPLLSYASYKISDARSYVKFENKTAGILDDSRRILVRKSIGDPVYQATFNTSVSYYKYYDLYGERGFVLLPFTISETNTIGITYRNNFVRYNVSTPVITGGAVPAGGLNDITVGGIFTGTVSTDFRAKIDATGTPDTFTWSNDGGVTWEAGGVNVSTSAITLEDGITLLWAADTGHTLNDYWDWTATPPSLADFNEDEQSGFPVNYAAYQVAKQLNDMDAARFRKDAVRHLEEWIERRATVDDTMDFSLSSPRRGRL